MGRGAIVIGLAAVIIGEAIFGRIFRNFGFTPAEPWPSVPSFIIWCCRLVIWLGIDTRSAEAV